MGCGEKIKVGINGCERIGREIAMILFFQDNYVELVAINDQSMPIDHMAALFNSVSSRLRAEQHDFKVKDENTLLFGEKSVTVHAIRNPEEIPWAKMGVEYVVESTGSFTDMDKAAAHLKAGAKKVVVTAISKDAPTYVFGVNHEEYRPESNIVSSASCAINQLAPILKVMQDEFLILESDVKIFESAIATHGPSMMDGRSRTLTKLISDGASLYLASENLIQVLHGSFGIFGALTQTLHTTYNIFNVAKAAGEFFLKIGDSLGIDDGPVITLIKLLSTPPATTTTDEPCSASSTDIIPADVEAVGKVLPYLYDNLTGTVSHVPNRDVSIVDLTVRLGAEATLEDIKAAMKKESEGRLRGILGYTESHNVSSDLAADSRSSIFSAKAGVSLNDENLFKFLFCFNNLRGYGYRVIDLIVHMASVEA